MFAYQQSTNREVESFAAKPQPQSALDELELWAATHLDTEIMEGAVEQLKNEQDAIKKKREKHMANRLSDGMLIVKSRDGAVFVLHSSHATQTCRGVSRMVELENDPDVLTSPVSMTFDCSAYVLDRIVHFWLFKVLEIRETRTLQHHHLNAPKTEDNKAMSTVGALIEFHDTVVCNRDDLARRILLAKLRFHLLGSLVTDNEILEGLEHIYKTCSGDNNNAYSQTLKRIFLSVLVRNGLSLTMGNNKEKFTQLATAYPALAVDAWRGGQFVHHFFGKKKEE